MNVLFSPQSVPEASLTNLKLILTAHEITKNLHELDMIVRLINILIRKFAEEDEMSLVWIRQWILESSDFIKLESESTN